MKRANGVWKLNNSFSKEKEYADTIKKTILKQFCNMEQLNIFQALYFILL